VWKYVAYLLLLGSLAVGAVAYAWSHHLVPEQPQAVREPDWLADLQSQNPRQVEKGTARVKALGNAALPEIEAAFRDPAADHDRRRAALRACGILGMTAAPLLPAVVTQLHDKTLTEEAAVALTFLGSGAYPPLRDATGAPDALLRREALRSIGKLHFRAGIPATAVVPLLSAGMEDEDAGVRTVAATYLGILNKAPDTAVPLLMDGLDDPVPDVRTAAATALGAFGSGAHVALPALKKAAGDADPDLAREAGRAIVKITSTGN
jgi:HEAT repeat protein